MLMYLEIKIKQLPRCDYVKVIVSIFLNHVKPRMVDFSVILKRLILPVAVSFSLPVIWAEQCIPAAG